MMLEGKTKSFSGTAYCGTASGVPTVWMLGTPSTSRVTLKSESCVAGRSSGMATIQPVDEGSIWFAGAGTHAGWSLPEYSPLTTPLLSTVGQAEPAAGFAAQVEFVGNVENIPDLLGVCDLHMCPTLSEEPLGLVVMEAKRLKDWIGTL